jgi:hypothetical protein
MATTPHTTGRDFSNAPQIVSTRMTSRWFSAESADHAGRLMTQMASRGDRSMRSDYSGLTLQ